MSARRWIVTRVSTAKTDTVIDVYHVRTRGEDEVMTPPAVVHVFGTDISCQTCQGERSMASRSCVHAQAVKRTIPAQEVRS